MSYCVNCGVELAQSERICPLCQTEVVNPNAPWQETTLRPYPPTMDRLMRRVNRRYLAVLISLFMLIPVAVVLLSDGLDGDLSWSLYVVGADALLEVWVMLPLAAKRFRRLTFLGFDSLAAVLYLLAIERISGGSWFLPVGLPITLAVSALLLLSAYLFRKAWGKQLLSRLAVFFLSSGVLAVVVEATTDLYLRGGAGLGWSPFVLSPCGILAAALLILQSRNGLREKIHRRIFY